MTNFNTDWEIDKLTKEGIINSSRCVSFFKKHNIKTAADIIKIHKDYGGEWGHIGEKGTPVKQCATNVFNASEQKDNVNLQALGETRFNLIKHLLSPNQRRKKIQYIRVLGDDDLYSVWYNLFGLYFKGKTNTNILFEHRLLFFNPDILSYAELQEKYSVKSGALRAAYSRIEQTLNKIFNILTTAGLVSNAQFNCDEFNGLMELTIKDDDKFYAAGLGDTLIDYIFPFINENCTSINQLVNDPKQEKKIVDGKHFFFNNNGVDVEYLKSLFKELKNRYYEYPVNLVIQIDKAKTIENNILGSLLSEIFPKTEPVIFNGIAQFRIELIAKTPSLATIILGIFNDENGKKEGADSYVATAEDIEKIIDVKVEYSFLRERTISQITTTMESIREIQSVGAGKYRLITSLKYGAGTSITIPIAILKPFREEGLEFNALIEIMNDGGYLWNENSIRSILQKYKAYFKNVNRRWFLLNEL